MANQKPPSFSEHTTLIDNLPVAVYTCNAEGQITFFNKAASELWGRKPELGKDLWCGSWKIYFPNGIPMDLKACPMAVALREGKIIEQEIIIERPDGEKRNILPHPQPLFNAKGELCGAINTLIDLTEHRKTGLPESAQEKKYYDSENARLAKTMRTPLQKSEDRYHKMIEEVRDYAILLLDVDGTILNWNQGAQNIKGYTEQEIVGKNFREFYLPADRENKVPEQLIAEAIAKGKATHEGYRVRKDGTTFWGSIVITALHDDDGNVIGFSKVTRDLTAKKLAEDQLVEYAKKLEAQNMELAQFGYIASHDLQEPLRKIQTFLYLCESEMDDKEAVRKYFNKINASAERMALLIKNLLEYSRLSHGERKFEQVDLAAILQDIEGDFELLLKEKQALITYHHLLPVKGIPFQINQLFSNLISNSLKFSVAQPVIDISCEVLDNQAALHEFPELDKDTRYIRITLRDNGIGFDPVYAKQIFGLFNRLNADSKYPGSGVGLAICKKIVENHQGFISAKGEKNKGATFTIMLPAE